MSVEPHKKIDIAKQQLETAICLFFYGQDYFSVLTLAGASEEIFSRILQLLGKEPALHAYARSVTQLFRVLYEKELVEIDIRKGANETRNSLKHFN